MQENRTVHIFLQSTHARKEKNIHTRQENKNTPQQHFQQTRRVRHIQEEQQEEEEQEDETVDGEAALYIKKLMQDWSSINIVRPTGFREAKKVSLNKDISRELWVKTKCLIQDLQDHLRNKPLRKKSQPNIVIQS